MYDEAAKRSRDERQPGLFGPEGEAAGAPGDPMSEAAAEAQEERRSASGPGVGVPGPAGGRARARREAGSPGDPGAAHDGAGGAPTVAELTASLEAAVGPRIAEVGSLVALLSGLPGADGVGVLGLAALPAGLDAEGRRAMAVLLDVFKGGGTTAGLLDEVDTNVVPLAAVTACAAWEERRARIAEGDVARALEAAGCRRSRRSDGTVVFMDGRRSIVATEVLSWLEARGVCSCGDLMGLAGAPEADGPGREEPFRHAWPALHVALSEVAALRVDEAACRAAGEWRAAAARQGTLRCPHCGRLLSGD